MTALPTLADLAADITAWSTLVLAVIATGALVANVWLARLTRRSLVFEQRQATVARRRSVPRLGIERAQPPQGPVASGTLTFVSGTDPALAVRVLVRRGAVYWYAALDRPIVPFIIPKNSQGWDGPGAFRADLVEADRRALVDEMPRANGCRDATEGCAVVAAWNAPDGTQLWCARRYRMETSPSPPPETASPERRNAGRLGDVWRADGPEMFGVDPPL
jgi:hypothetical protein